MGHNAVGEQLPACACTVPAEFSIFRSRPMVSPTLKQAPGMHNYWDSLTCVSRGAKVTETAQCSLYVLSDVLSVMFSGYSVGSRSAHPSSSEPYK